MVSITGSGIEKRINGFRRGQKHVIDVNLVSDKGSTLKQRMKKASFNKLSLGPFGNSYVVWSLTPEK